MFFALSYEYRHDLFLCFDPKCLHFTYFPLSLLKAAINKATSQVSILRQPFQLCIFFTQRSRNTQYNVVSRYLHFRFFSIYGSQPQHSLYCSSHLHPDDYIFLAYSMWLCVDIFVGEFSTSVASICQFGVSWYISSIIFLYFL